MTKVAAKLKLKNAGYLLTTSARGGYIAKKGQRTYTADTLNALIAKIFG